MLSENLKWDVAIVGNEVAMVNYVKLKLYILLQVSREWIAFENKCGEAQTKVIWLLFKSIYYADVAQSVMSTCLTSRGS